MTATDTQGSTRQQRAVQMLRNGDSKRQVMAALGVDEPWLAQAIQTVTGSPPRPQSLTVVPTHPLPPPAEPARDAIAQLLTRADDSSSKPAKRAAARIRGAIIELREALDAAAESDRLAGELRAERDQVQADIVAARRALDDANARAKALKLRTPPKTAGKSATGLVNARDVRGWARENRVDCPAHGPVPAAVRQQYESREA